MSVCLENCSKHLSCICDDLLQLSWTNEAIGKRKFSSKDIGVLSRINVQYAVDPIAKVSSIVGHLNDIDFEVEDDHAQGYPTIKGATYILFYTPLYQVLTRLLNEIVESYKGDKDSNKNNIEYDFQSMIENLNHIVKALLSLMMITKGDSIKNSILLTALREGGKFIAAFMKAEKLIMRLYDANTKATIALVSCLQKSTRQMQVLCVHGKLIKNASLSKEVPAIKRSLEKMIYMMKKLLDNKINNMGPYKLIMWDLGVDQRNNKNKRKCGTFVSTSRT
jgi:hypothetical protein